MSGAATIEAERVTVSSQPRIAAPDKPRLVSSDTTPAGSVPEILAEVLEAGQGSRVEIEEAYKAYAAACAAIQRRAVTPTQFVELLQKFCQGCRIKTLQRGEHVYLVNVRLTAFERMQGEAV